MYNPFSLEGKTILITGASSGIGQRTAIECSKLGAKVIITGRNEERLNETFNSLTGDGHLLFTADLNSNEDINSLVDSIPEIDGCVCNAGISKLQPVQFIKEEDLMNVFRVNTVAPVLLVQRLVKKKKIKKGGSIVFTSSISGNFTVAIAHSLYSISKGALSSFMRNAAMDLGAKRIRCNAVTPGMINTKLIHGGELSEEDLKEDLNNYPLGRYGEPEDVAYGIIYLLSDASAWVTGISLVIDGGFTLR
jgi:NAD(P)-dependent dehydrogenase (short-subunit alcohol dehydrogenase family)